MANVKTQKGYQVPLAPASDIGRWAGRPQTAKVMSAGRPALAPGIVHAHVNTLGEAPYLQLPMWRDRLGYILDVPISRAQLAGGFNGQLDRYLVNDLVLIDAVTDRQQLKRQVARISTDAIRSYSFHIVLGGGIGDVTGLYRKRSAQSLTDRCILILDLNQPFNMDRLAGRVVNFFAPRALVESIFHDAESLHGRVIDDTSPLTRTIFDHVTALIQELPAMNVSQADSAIRAGVHLIVAAFQQQAGLSGNTRAAARSVMFGLVRRHIQSHLHEADLSPEYLLDRLQLPRRTLYRLFEHEGGIEAYIRHSRLREAAAELATRRDLSVMDIAYVLGFKSAQDFARAFRRAYDMAPQDLRAQALDRVSERSTNRNIYDGIERLRSQQEK